MVATSSKGNGRSTSGGHSRRRVRRVESGASSLLSLSGRLTAPLTGRLFVLVVLIVASFAVTYLAGGAGKFNPQIYWFPILAATFWFGPIGGVLVAVLAGTLAGPLTPADTASGEAQALGDWLPRIFYFAGVALVVGLANARLRKQNEDLESATRSLESTNRRLAAAEGETRDRTRALRHTVAQQGQLLAEIRALQALDSAIIAGSGEHELMELSTRLLAELTGAKTCAMVVPAADSSHLSLAAVHGMPPKDVPRAAELVGRLQVGESVAGWAILQGEPTSSADLLADPRYSRGQPLVQHLGVGSALAAPIMDGDTAIGALLAAFAERGEADSHRLEQVTRFANQLSVCIRYTRQHSTLKTLTLETAFALAEAIESRDPHTADHCTRLAHYAELLATSVGLAERETELIRYGAALHDAGKVGVSDAVLKKPDKLTPEEWAEIRLHPYIGGQICKRVTFLRDVYAIVYYHHERYDGEGYPDGLRGQDIPLAARIVAIADAYDAMTSRRSYRAAMTHAQAVRELRKGAGSQWDPDLVPVFLNALQRGASHNNRARHQAAARESRRNARSPATVA